MLRPVAKSLQRGELENTSSKSLPKFEPPPYRISLRPFLYLIVYIFCIVLLYRLNRANTPSIRVLNSTSEGFNLKNARSFLRELNELGPRIFGTSKNDIVASNYILDTLIRLRTSASDDILFDIDVQRPSGYLNHEGYLNGFTNVYTNITNIIARISYRRKEDGNNLDSSVDSIPAILINAHFDR